MKVILSSLLLVTLSSLCFSQKDSTSIIFITQTDRNLRMRDELLGIQQIDIECTDTMMKGKKFFLTVSEFQDGRIISSDTSNANCGEEVIPIKMGERLINMHVDICHKMAFSKRDSSFKLSFIGLFENDVFEMRIIYPGKRSAIELTGKENYSLRWVDLCSGRNQIRIPIGEKIPVLTYAPPVKSEKEGYGSYCIQGETDVETWFESFRIPHYYVFYLEVE